MTSHEESPNRESTLELVQRHRAGDEDAASLIVARVLPRLKRWARGRLPPHARFGHDTADFVQETVTQSFRVLGVLDVGHEGALMAYLRQATLHRIQDQIRRARREPQHLTESPDIPTDLDSPLDRLMGKESVERYERALEKLRQSDREVIVARIELHHSYQDIAQYCNLPSANAARLKVRRAFIRLAQEMSSARE